MFNVAKKKNSATDETSTEEPLDLSAHSTEDDTDTKPDEAAAEDAPAEETTSPEQDSDEGPGTDEQRNEAETSDSAAPETAEDTVENADEEPVDEDVTEETLAESEATTEPETPAPSPAAPAEKVIVERGGFLSMLFGGAAAAAIGFGLSLAILPDGLPRDGRQQDTFRQDIEARLAGQSETLASVETRLEALGSGPDLSPIETELTAFGAAIADIGDRLASAQGALDDIETRLTAVEKLPVTSGASEAAVAAYERELETLREAMATQRAEIEAMIEDARAVEDDAEETARAAMRRAAITRILTALDTGVGFAPALTDLQSSGAEVPEILPNVANDGVVSLSQLQESFPDAARAALAASRAVAAESGDTGGFGEFLRNQLGARSLEPREGNDPDAILSRAEAAMREGRLTDALAEIEALPEEGRAELTDWAAQVSERLDAMAAAQALSETMN